MIRTLTDAIRSLEHVRDNTGYSVRAQELIDFLRVLLVQEGDDLIEVHYEEPRHRGPAIESEDA